MNNNILSLLSAQTFAERLNISDKKLTRLINTNKVCYVSQNNNLLFPAFQIFQGRIIGGLDQVLSILNEKESGSGTSAVTWIFLELEKFRGSSIVDMLNRGEVEKAKQAAYHVIDTSYDAL